MDCYFTDDWELCGIRKPKAANILDASVFSLVSDQSIQSRTEIFQIAGTKADWQIYRPINPIYRRADIVSGQLVNTPRGFVEVV